MAASNPPAPVAKAGSRPSPKPPSPSAKAPASIIGMPYAGSGWPSETMLVTLDALNTCSVARMPLSEKPERLGAALPSVPSHPVATLPTASEDRR